MVSAPTGRVCKKKCTSRSCNDGNSDCHSLHNSTFIECISIPLSTSCMRSLCCILSSVRRFGCPRTSFYRASFFRFLFLSFERRRCGAAIPQVILAPNVTLIAHSSTFRKYDQRKNIACIASTESNFHLRVQKRPYVYRFIRDERELIPRIAFTLFKDTSD